MRTGPEARNESFSPSQSLALLFLVPALTLALAWGASQLFDRSLPLLAFLHKRLPPLEQGPEHLRLESQLFDLWVRARTAPDTAGMVPIIGSSSAGNGIDMRIAGPAFEARGYQAANFGQVIFMAHELVFLEDLLLRPGRRALVFVYNPWMFADIPDERAMRRRWNTAAVLRLFGPAQWRPEHLDAVLEGWGAEQASLLRFNTLLRRQLWQALTGTLPPPQEPSRAITAEKDARAYKAAAGPVLTEKLDAKALRVHKESLRADATLGWRGLEHFLERARARGVRVIAVPFPLTPDYFLHYMQGADIRPIDERVCRLVAGAGGACLARAALPDFQAVDFRDIVHLRADGRTRFSEWFARNVPPLLTEDSGAAGA
jgi:hypothetical protein